MASNAPISFARGAPSLDIVDVEKFTPVVRHLTRRAGIMISAEVGGVLLIDQREVSPPEEIR